MKNTKLCIYRNGVYWNKLRKYVNPLLNKSYISSFSSKNYDIAQAFVSYVKKRRNEDNMLLDVCSHVYRYSTECMYISYNFIYCFFYCCIVFRHFTF